MALYLLTDGNSAAVVRAKNGEAAKDVASMPSAEVKRLMDSGADEVVYEHRAARFRKPRLLSDRPETEHVADETT